MGVVARTRASLRFFGEALDPSAITEALGMRPTSSTRKGDVLPSGHVLSKGSWRYRARDAEPGDLDGQIRRLLMAGTPDVSVWRELARHYQADVFCGLFLAESNEGLSVAPATLMLLSERGLKLGSDIYKADSAAEPQLFTTDLRRSLDWFSALGFETNFTAGEPEFYGQVRREGARLNLRLVQTHPFSSSVVEAEPDLLVATIVTDKVAALFSEFVGMGIEMHQPLETQSWGAQTFIVRDPDGNLICFAG